MLSLLRLSIIIFLTSSRMGYHQRASRNSTSPARKYKGAYYNYRIRREQKG